MIAGYRPKEKSMMRDLNDLERARVFLASLGELTAQVLCAAPTASSPRTAIGDGQLRC